MKLIATFIQNQSHILWNIEAHQSGIVLKPLVDPDRPSTDAINSSTYGVDDATQHMLSDSKKDDDLLDEYDMNAMSLDSDEADDSKEESGGMFQRFQLLQKKLLAVQSTIGNVVDVIEGIQK